ncbi:hypothetical protein ABZ891_14760 [Streptomyces sp. NPDC047023]|uniref:hypothetical protein n=1 Tax=Streptomyces sp. NPDC047023 TaxID=3155139 RepID=UPI0033EE2130
MSARAERPALTPGTSLHDYAAFLHGIDPDGRVPSGGHPLPGGPPPGPLRSREVERVLTELLPPALADPDPARAAARLDRCLPERGMHPDDVYGLAGLPLPDEAAARALGRRLLLTAKDPAALAVGISLVGKLGGPEDVPGLTTIALLEGFLQPVLYTLASLRCDTEVLIRLIGVLHPDDHARVISQLASRDDPAARDWLLNLPVGPHTGSSQARHVALAVRLADLLEAEHPGTAALAQGARLLNRMAPEGGTGSPAEILSYKPAVRVYEALVRRADRLPPTLDHHAVLLSLALDLSSGPPVLLDWRPGLREELLVRLDRLLSTPDWAAAPDGARTHEDRCRAGWIRRMRREPFDRTTPDGLRIHVVERDPRFGDDVETRILLDGRPLVPRVFPQGRSPAPESVLGRDLLRATPEEREVTLATAYCAEGCCGTLTVTVRRDGDHVVWQGRRRDDPGPRLPEHRFDAAAYDAEVERARTDDTWCRPARGTARLIAAGLHERPGLLARWGIPLSWCGTAGPYEETVVLRLAFGPGVSGATGREASQWVRMEWRLPDDGRPPAQRAAAALERLATTDPRTYARFRDGNREYAASLGLRLPDEH